MPKHFTLGKEERLKSRKLIEQLFKQGRTFTVLPYRVYYVKTDTTTVDQAPKETLTSSNQLKLGVGAGTKNFKKAVDRNRIKRITREAWRLQKNDLQLKLKLQHASLNVFLLYTSKELPEYKLVYDKVNVILTKLVKLFDENTAPLT